MIFTFSSKFDENAKYTGMKIIPASMYSVPIVIDVVICDRGMLGLA
jgi:hypothetical protein